MATTKQGVRDLGGNDARPQPKGPPPIQCIHEMVDHCGSAGRMPCGHLVCLGCGMGFDVAANQ